MTSNFSVKYFLDQTKQKKKRNYFSNILSDVSEFTKCLVHIVSNL